NRLDAGDVMVIYSDGISEACDEQGREFGIESLTEVVVANRHLSVSALRDQIEGALSRFTHGAPATDDVTLVIIKRREAQTD
ncbi:SpoIIE family protein phosphatase, partial [Acinetobacter baumannii]